MTIDLRVTRTRSGRITSVSLFPDEEQARNILMDAARLFGPLTWAEIVGHVQRFDDADGDPYEEHAALEGIDLIIGDVRAEHSDPARPDDDPVTSLWCITVPEQDENVFANRLHAAFNPPVVVHPSQRRLRSVPNPGGAA